MEGILREREFSSPYGEINCCQHCWLCSVQGMLSSPYGEINGVAGAYGRRKTWLRVFVPLRGN